MKTKYEYLVQTYTCTTNLQSGINMWAEHGYEVVSVTSYIEPVMKLSEFAVTFKKGI